MQKAQLKTDVTFNTKRKDTYGKPFRPVLVKAGTIVEYRKISLNNLTLIEVSFHDEFDIRWYARQVLVEEKDVV